MAVRPKVAGRLHQAPGRVEEPTIVQAMQKLAARGIHANKSQPGSVLFVVFLTVLFRIRDIEVSAYVLYVERSVSARHVVFCKFLLEFKDSFEPCIEDLNLSLAEVGNIEIIVCSIAPAVDGGYGCALEDGAFLLIHNLDGVGWVRH